MKTNLTFAAAVLILVSGTSLAKLLPGEGIIRDPITGDYTANYLYEDETGSELVTSTLTTATKIDPTLASSVQLMADWSTLYQYNLANGSNAKQPIDDFSFSDLPPSVSIMGSTSIIDDRNNQMEFFGEALTLPNLNWQSSGRRIIGASSEVNISWYHLNENFDTSLGIQPNATLGGFGLISNDLPGIAVARLQGNTGYGHFSQQTESSPDSTITDDMDAIEKIDFVPRNAAAPMIAVPTPYDAAVTLENIQTHVHTWVGKQLLDTAFSAQLDTSFQAAIAAYHANQQQTAIVQLQTMRTLIKQQQPDADKNDVTPTINLPTPPALIDLLAARILYFDLGYVISR